MHSRIYDITHILHKLLQRHQTAKYEKNNNLELSNKNIFLNKKAQLTQGEARDSLGI